MKRFLKKRKMRGFTLVELLIVIIIIGILAGALLLVAGAGTDKAQASKIVSDLRSLKSGMLMYYADNNVWLGVASIDELEGYLDRDISTDKFDIFGPSEGTVANCTLWVGYAPGTIDTGVQGKLNTSDAGIYQGDGSGSPTATAYGTGNEVWMMVK